MIRSKKPIPKPHPIRKNECRICRHPQVKQINRMISRGESLVKIGRQFFEPGVSDPAMCARITHHTRNHLGLSIAAILAKQRDDQALDVLAEFRELHEFSRKLLSAATVYLTDPDQPQKFALDAQGTEIDIIYEMESDKGLRGPKKRMRASLQELIDRISLNSDKTNVGKILQVSVRHDDIRTFSLNAIKTAEGVLDKLARLGGLYQRERRNEADAAEMAERLTQRLVETGWDESDARAWAAQRYLQPASNAVN